MVMIQVDDASEADVLEEPLKHHSASGSKCKLMRVRSPQLSPRSPQQAAQSVTAIPCLEPVEIRVAQLEAQLAESQRKEADQKWRRATAERRLAEVETRLAESQADAANERSQREAIEIRLAEREASEADARSRRDAVESLLDEVESQIVNQNVLQSCRVGARSIATQTEQDDDGQLSEELLGSRAPEISGHAEDIVQPRFSARDRKGWSVEEIGERVLVAVVEAMGRTLFSQCGPIRSGEVVFAEKPLAAIWPRKLPALLTWLQSETLSLKIDPLVHYAALWSFTLTLDVQEQLDELCIAPPSSSFGSSAHEDAQQILPEDSPLRKMEAELNVDRGRNRGGRQ